MCDYRPAALLSPRVKVGAWRSEWIRRWEVVLPVRPRTDAYLAGQIASQSPTSVANCQVIPNAFQCWWAARESNPKAFAGVYSGGVRWPRTSTKQHFAFKIGLFEEGVSPPKSTDFHRLACQLPVKNPPAFAPVLRSPTNHAPCPRGFRRAGIRARPVKNRSDRDS